MSKAKFLIGLLESIKDIEGVYEFALSPHVGLFFVIVREGKEDEIVWEGDKIKEMIPKTGYVSSDKYMHDQFVKEVIARYKEEAEGEYKSKYGFTANDLEDADWSDWSDWEKIPKDKDIKLYGGRVGYSFDKDIFDVSLPYELWKDEKKREQVTNKVCKVMGIPIGKVNIEVKSITV